MSSQARCALRVARCALRVDRVDRTPRRRACIPHFARNTISFIRTSIGETTGTVSIVLATAINSSAVKV